MLFSSITFLVFFLPVLLVFYFALPSLLYKNYVLFIASLLFYAWGEPKFILLMFFSIIFNYNMGLLIGKNDKEKRKILFFAIFVNIAILFLFKYLGFSFKIINIVLTSLHFKSLSTFNFILPLGISFYTFQEISYLVDVYRKPELAQKSLLNLGLYVSFFPQLIAGPIVRYHEISSQISYRIVTVERFSLGLERFIIGLAKKVLLANTFAKVCDSFYGATFFSYGTYSAWISAFAYALQIYYDFSGYSDMAIGLAKMFGFELQENFNYPYAASSISDFWKRWHISLTNFFRDYLYIPLGGNRKGSVRTILNRYIVFFITGLWHGAAFNFIIWGLTHGSLMALERFIEKKICKKNIVLRFIKRGFMLFSVLILWVLFRNGTKNTVKLCLKMIGINYTTLTSHFVPIVIDEFLLLNLDTHFYVMAIIGVLFAFPWWRKVTFFYSENKIISVILTFLKYISLGCLFVLCYASLVNNSYNPFIYFRF